MATLKDLSDMLQIMQKQPRKCCCKRGYVSNGFVCNNCKQEIKRSVDLSEKGPARQAREQIWLRRIGGQDIDIGNFDGKFNYVDKRGRDRRDLSFSSLSYALIGYDEETRTMREVENWDLNDE